MKASIGSVGGGYVSYKVVDGDNEYWVFRGEYTRIDRRRRSDRCPVHVSIDGIQHAALRARIDAAIAELKGTDAKPQ